MSHYPFYGYPAVYVDMDIVSFDAVPPVAELGSSVDSVQLTWKFSKKPLTLEVNGVTYQTNTLSIPSVPGPFTTKQSWSIKVGDAEIEVSARTQLQFVNKGYWDFVATAPTTSADILALANSDFRLTDYQMTVTLGTPVGLVFCYAYPARFGLPRLVNLLAPSGIWQPVANNIAFTDYTQSTVSFTNVSGYTEDYTVLTFNAALPYDSTVVQFLKTSKAPYTNNVDWNLTDDGFGGAPDEPFPIGDSLYSDE